MTPKSQLLSQFPEILQGFSSRTTRPDIKDPVFVKQVHGNAIYDATGEDVGDPVEADAIITDKLNLPIVIKTADCVPVLFYGPENKVVAAAHAGWRGTGKKIVEEVIKKFQEDYDVKPEEIYASIGPAICGECYDISTTQDGRIELFEDLYTQDDHVVLRKDGKISLDLQQANKVQLLRSGVPEAQIEVYNACTFENPQVWPSYRRTPRDLECQIWSYIMLK